ncbi:flagellin lysine-N-methylase [Orenia marismortui]|uniref:flagellin lysine-N-methylase n=1 Tax=Orenia marismortui TaxID=46469 RepID=UPI00036B05B3|nr:flagellin lysine-N-methylase [Orenia marismortui]
MAQIIYSKKIKKIVDLYDGLIVSCLEIKEGLEENQLDLIENKIKEIKIKLMNSLDVDELGELVETLYNIHQDINRLLIEFTYNRDLELLNKVINILQDLKDNLEVEFRYKALLPTYMKKFKCIASNCEESCCKGWRVLVDQDSYQLYQQIEDEGLKKTINNNIKINKSDENNSSYAYIKLKEDNSCPFLTKDELCNIHLKKGENYLCDTCAIYPRTTINLVDNILEVSATMSCPEIRRLALLNKSGIKFEYVNDYLFDRNVNINFNTEKIKDNNPKKYFKEIRSLSIGLLQNREYSLKERLIFLGIICNSLEKNIQNDKVEDISEVIDYYKMLNKNKFNFDISKISSKEDIQIQILNKIINMKINNNINNNYFSKLKEAIKGITIAGESLEESVNRYRESYRVYYKLFMQQHEYLLENYLVNYIFKNLFPLGSDKSLFDEYVLFIIHYSIIKMLLIGLSAFHKGLSVEVVIDLIGTFSRVLEHDSSYFKSVYEFIKENEFDTLAYMTVLIKN